MRKNFITRWLHAIYPAILPIFLLLGTVMIFYGNLGLKNRSNSQKSIIQKLDLLEWQLLQAGSPPNISKKTLTVSLSETDSENFHISQEGSIRNISPSEQINLARKLLSAGAEHIYIHWFYRHNFDLRELNNFKKLFADEPAITLIASFDQAQGLRDFVDNKLEILVSDFCNGKRRTICPFDPQWSFLAIQHFAQRYGKLDNSNLSPSLPNPLNSYIMRPLDRNFLEKTTYSDAAQFKPDLISGKIIFMGSDLIQGNPGMTLPEDVGKIPGLFQSENNPVRTLGVPIHEYFASIVEANFSSEWIKVASKAVENSLRVLGPLCVILMVLFFGVTAGTCFFLIGSLLLIVGNIVCIRLWSFYIPDYDCVFLSSLALIGSGYIKNSIEQFEFALAQNRQRALENNTDLKSNFISLFSHNLNTPIAKIRGLINSLEKTSPEHKAVFHEMNIHLTDMQTDIKAILTKTRLEDNYVNLESLTRDKLVEEIVYEISPMMKRRSVDFHFELDMDSGFYEDKKLFTALITSISIYAPRNSQLWFSLVVNEGNLILEWISTGTVPSWEQFAKNNNELAQQNSLDSFILFYLEKRKAHLTHTQEDGGAQLKIRIPTEIERKETPHFLAEKS